MLVITLLLTGCTTDFVLSPESDGGAPPDGGDRDGGDRDGGGRDGGVPALDPIVRTPYTCGGSGSLDFQLHLDAPILDSDDDGSLVHAIFTEVGAAREPRVIGISNRGVSGPKGISTARVFASTAPCVRADAPAPPIFAAAPMRIVVEALATEFRGSPLVVTTSQAPAGFLYRDEAPPFRLDLDLDATLAAHGTQRSVAVGDVDGDGVEDLVMGNIGEVRVAHPTTANPSQVVPGLAAAHRVWLVDFDVDGHLDLLIAPHVPPPVTYSQPDDPEPAPVAPPRRLWLGDGTGRFAPPAGSDGRVDTVTARGPIAVLDIDLDGDPDVVQWTGWEEQFPELLRNESVPGAPRFASPQRLESVGVDTVAYGEGMRAVAAVADLDLDGAPDVVLQSAQVWVMVRAGAVPRVHTISSLKGGGGSPEHPRIAVGDVDQDGDVDYGMVTVGETPNGPERRLVVIASTAGGARSVGIRLRGVPTAGTEVCLFAEGELPEDGRCVGALLGHSLGIATTAQSDLASTRIFTVPAPHARVDVRVLTRTRDGAAAHDFPGLEVGARYDLTVD